MHWNFVEIESSISTGFFSSSPNFHFVLIIHALLPAVAPSVCDYDLVVHLASSHISSSVLKNTSPSGLKNIFKCFLMFSKSPTSFAISLSFSLEENSGERRWLLHKNTWALSLYLPTNWASPQFSSLLPLRTLHVSNVSNKTKWSSPPSSPSCKADLNMCVFVGV